jgi:hypothetical protein
MGNMTKITIGCACGLRYAVFAKTVCPRDSIVQSTPSVASILVGCSKTPRTDINFSDLNKKFDILCKYVYNIKAHNNRLVSKRKYFGFVEISRKVKRFMLKFLDVLLRFCYPHQERSNLEWTTESHRYRAWLVALPASVSINCTYM